MADTNNGGMLGILDRRLKSCERVLVGVAVVFTAVMALIICYSTMMRFFVGGRVGWSVEISEYMMLYIAFFSAAWILQLDKHVKVTLLTDRLKGRAKECVQLLIAAVVLVASFSLFWFGCKVTWDSIERGIVIMNIMAIPKHFVLMAIPIGGLFLFLRSLLLFVMQVSVLFASLPERSDRAAVHQDMNYRKA